MTTLAIIGAIIGYLLIGMIFARILYLAGWLNEPHEPILAVIGWAIYLPFVAFIAAGIGMHRLITMPTRPERIRAKIERTQQRIDQLEAELGLKDRNRP
jgi:Na+/melibiose symporter-like transporter